MALTLKTGETAGISFVKVLGEVDVSCAAEQGITFSVAHPQRNVARVLELLGVQGDLGIVDD